MTPRAAVERWLEQVVIALNLCPFAFGPWRDGTVHIAVADDTHVDGVVARVGAELADLAALPEAARATTLVAAPRLEDWAAFREAVGKVEALIDAAGHADLFQVVGFHPRAVYAGADPDDPANAAARAPVPVIHLLRADAVERAIDSHPDAAGISDRNAARLRLLGWDRLPDPSLR